MNIGFRHADSRFPFFWETSSQPSARWHQVGSGPVQCMADTPDGAWAEFLRHEEITDLSELAGIARSLWAVRLPAHIETAEDVTIPEATGGIDSYSRCQDYAAQRRAAEGTFPALPGWCAVEHGSPPARVLSRVRHLT